MTTKFLKFASEIEAQTVLSNFYTIEEGWQTASATHALDPVGTIYKPTGNYLTDEDGNQYQEQAPVDGYHINFIGDLSDEIMATYATYPVTPARVFAG